MNDKQDKQAIGLRYDGQQAPHVSSRGSGEMAEQILTMAREEGLYIHEDPQLLERLLGLQDGEQIPPALYVVIAEILAYSFLLQGRFPDHWQRPDGASGLDTQA